jgi:hypothetical protein
MRRQLEALRPDAETDYIVEALLTLHEEAERRHKERVRQCEDSWRRSKERKQQAAAEQGLAAERDPNPGWEF